LAAPSPSFSKRRPTYRHLCLGDLPERLAVRGQIDREGLSPAIVPSIVEGLGNIRAFGHAVFIAESNIHHVPDFTDRLYVIERGEIIFAGKPTEARRNPAVARVIEGTGQSVAV